MIQLGIDISRQECYIWRDHRISFVFGEGYYQMSCPAHNESIFKNIKPSPRVKLAVRLYTTGICKTKREAGEAAGLHPSYLTMLTGPNGSDPVKNLMSEIDEQIANKTIETSAIIQSLGRKALGKMGKLMETGSEGVQFRSAQDLLDRSPETSKTQRIETIAFSLDGEDAATLAKAMIESAKSDKDYDSIAEEGLMEVDLTEHTELPEHARVANVPVEQTYLPRPTCREPTGLERKE